MNNSVDIKKNIKLFSEGKGKNKGRRADERYASFDYCYNYFQSFRENNKLSDLCKPDQIQVSCLQLAFYLASWGMLRGSTFLLEKSVKYYEDTIILISKYNKKIWSINIDSYNDENIDILLDFKNYLIDVLKTDRKPSDTLITKIMLGVFGNIPAFDASFGKGFGIRILNKNSLKKISEFYQNNKTLINSYKIYTFDYLTGKDSKRLYSQAKIIDMIGFIEGQYIKK